MDGVLAVYEKKEKVLSKTKFWVGFSVGRGGERRVIFFSP